jgi:hypothetical protein
LHCKEIDTVLLTKKGSLWLYTSFIVPNGPRLPSMSLSCELSTTDCSSDTWLMAFTRSFGRARPEKFSFSVRTYPSLGGSTTSANLWYAFLVSCSVASGKPVEEGAASWERDGVDIDRYTFSGSDAEACNVFADA